MHFFLQASYGDQGPKEDKTKAVADDHDEGSEYLHEK